MNTTFVKIGIPILIGIISTYFSYYLGRRKKIDEALLTKKVELAQKISFLLHKVHTQYCIIETLWDRNFSQMDFHEAINQFVCCSIYDEDRERIDEVHKSATKLNELYSDSAIYVDRKFRALLGEYLDLCHFTFTHDGSGFFNNQSERFFENLKNTSKRRAFLYTKLKKSFAKLVK